MTLLSDGRDVPPHVHVLPRVPVDESPRVTLSGVLVPGATPVSGPVVDAVASCGQCHALFVSRYVDDGWTGSVQWVPLRWWHRRARRILREAVSKRADDDPLVGPAS